MYGYLLKNIHLVKKLGLKTTATGYPVNIHLFKVNKINTRKRSEICSKFTIKISERRHDLFSKRTKSSDLVIFTEEIMTSF